MNNTVLKNECENVRTQRIFGCEQAVAPTSDWRHSLVIANIQSAISAYLKGKPCKVFSQNVGLLLNCADESRKADYYEPDIMIICDTAKIINGYYSGVPKFIVEVASRTTAKFDRTIKMSDYARLGVSEYWIVRTLGTVEVYYLVNGSYTLEGDYTLCRERNSDDYNEKFELSLRDFPDIKLTLGDIFD